MFYLLQKVNIDEGPLQLASRCVDFIFVELLCFF